MGREGLALFSGVEAKEAEAQRSNCCDLPSAFQAEVPGFLTAVSSGEPTPWSFIS